MDYIIDELFMKLFLLFSCDICWPVGRSAGNSCPKLGVVLQLTFYAASKVLLQKEGTYDGDGTFKSER